MGINKKLQIFWNIKGTWNPNRNGLHLHKKLEDQQENKESMIKWQHNPLKTNQELPM